MTERRLTTYEAIAARRSIRRFKPDAVPEEAVEAMIEAARLAPSGCNAQPWRFRVVTDRATRVKLTHAAHRQQFIARAPLVIVCAADVNAYLDGTASGIQDLGRIGAVEDRIVQIIVDRTERRRAMDVRELGPSVAFNVAIAVEHIALRALDFGLGTCWVRLINEDEVKGIFNWGPGIHVACLLVAGYPAEEPAPRGRKSAQELMI